MTVQSSVQISRDNGVTTLILDRPERRNALNLTMVQELQAALDAAASDDSVRVVVLTGAGSTFCSGADLTDAAEGGAESFAGGVPAAFADLLSAMVDHPKPIIGRVQGHVAGGGIGLVAACDLAAAVDGAWFAFAEVRLGVVPAVIAPYVLRKIAPAAASELMLTGERVSAEVVREAGLVQRVVRSESLDATVFAWVAQLRRGGPQALAVTKRVLTRVTTMERAEARSWTTAVSAAAFGSVEAQEGIAAYAARRDPSWAGPGATPS